MLILGADPRSTWGGSTASISQSSNCQSLIIDPGGKGKLRTMQPYYLRSKHGLQLVVQISQELQFCLSTNL